MRLELPWPHKAAGNRRLVPARGRWITAPAYRAWQQACAVALANQLRGFAGGEMPVAVFIEACVPDNHNRDLDGLIKGTLDVLVKAGALPGDDTRYITYVACYLGPVTTGGLLRVTIESNA